MNNLKLEHNGSSLTRVAERVLSKHGRDMAEAADSLLSMVM